MYRDTVFSSSHPWIAFQIDYHCRYCHLMWCENPPHWRQWQVWACLMILSSCVCALTTLVIIHVCALIPSSCRPSWSSALKLVAPKRSERPQSVLCNSGRNERLLLFTSSEVWKCEGRGSFERVSWHDLILPSSFATLIIWGRLVAGNLTMSHPLSEVWVQHQVVRKVLASASGVPRFGLTSSSTTCWFWENGRRCSTLYHFSKWPFRPALAWKKVVFLLGIIFFICLFPLNFLVSFFFLISPLFNLLLSFPWLPEACLWKSSQLSWQFRHESQSGVTLSKGLKSLSAKGLKSLSAKGKLSQCNASRSSVLRLLFLKYSS